MPSSPTRKRVRKLLNELWDLQTNDVPMTASTLLQIKYLLGGSKKCNRVEVVSSMLLAESPNCPFEITHDRLSTFFPTSNFTRCQLEDQKLTGVRSHHCQQDLIALTAILSLLDLVCSSKSSPKRSTHPTQFRWHCSLTHRTHIIFAFIDINMKSRVYGIEELLNLRTSALPDVLVGVNYQGKELAEMVRNKSRVNSVSSRNYNPNSLKRDRKKTMDDSSTASEEVVFKGSMSRRPIKQEPFPVNNIDSIKVPAPTSVPALSEKPLAAAVVPAPETDQLTEWKYRGRSGSEVASDEPLPAPTGITAQQSEGFQRFYKAVVSPTHVRVTAGGRIVPNTRNPTSPTAKRPKDTESIINDEKAEPVPVSASVPKQPAPMMGMPHPMPFFYPGFPGMSPMHPMTGMPMPMMPPGFPFPVPVSAAPTSTRTEEAIHKENQSKKTGDNNAASESQSGKPDIKLSPPDQFDHTKPFIYNGQQWMFPMFPGPYPGFLGMPPPGYAGHMPGPQMMMPPQMPMAPMMGPMGLMGPTGPTGLASSAGVPTMVAATLSSSRLSNPQPPSKPPISSIRPSQITRKQIDGLQANLKYHEDQLQYNKHQIDEKDMAHKIEMLNHDIERFEKVFRAQSAFEEKNYPKTDKDKDEVISSSGRSSVPSSKTQSQSEESKESKESKATTMTDTSYPQSKLRKKDRSRDSVGLNSNKSSSASYTMEDSVHDRLLNSVHAGKKSSLPSGAARAPIFQPRSVSTFSCPVPSNKGQAWQSVKADGGITQEQLEAAEKILVAAGAKAWNMPQQVNGSSGQPSSRGSPRRKDDLGVPYLIGTIPRHVNVHAGHRFEYEYNRKLTDEEVQARHLYFGKAPRSVSQGLPKYDGKNFYPPSPVKHTTPSVSPSVRRSRVHIRVPEVGYSFAIPDGKELDPFSAATLKETILKAKETVVGSKASSVMSTRSFSSQADDHAEEFEKALAESKKFEETEGSHDSLSRVSVAETKSVDYSDARSNGTSSKLWQNMLKRGFTASDVLPSTVTSTTAQGYLPHFVGHATTSLSPTLSGTIVSSSRESPPKDADTNPNGSTFMAPKSGENAPPVTADRISISETIRNMVGMKSPAWAH